MSWNRTLPSAPSSTLDRRAERSHRVGLAVGAERLGRLKPNGRLGTYSPLSRFIELDLLVMGIEGKRVLWANLRDLAGLASRLPDVDFDKLIELAEQQRAELEPFRVRAGAEAFARADEDAPQAAEDLDDAGNAAGGGERPGHP